MRCKASCIVFLFLGIVQMYSQTRAGEIGIITDNDLYTSSKNDMYYTNGLAFFYRFVTKNNKQNIDKEITEINFGQYIYTPRFIDSPDVELMDRPYAGYLFASYGKSLFFKKESVLQMNFQFGYVGPNAFGKETQKTFHDIVGYKTVRGWEYQIQNALAVQSSILFSKKLFVNKNNNKVDFHWRSEANFGTVFTGVSTGFVSRIGLKKLVGIPSSNLYGGAAGSAENEFYFYVAPSINYQLYDATIQGSQFNNNSPVTFGLVPFRFNGEAGFKYRKNNLNVSYAFVYRGKELYSKTISGFFYGSIGVSYLVK